MNFFLASFSQNMLSEYLPKIYLGKRFASPGDDLVRNKTKSEILF